ncbi:ArnT family glycosyltransferase [Nocardioides donggukensis]|uniref:Glycosyltransferase family 39 protein n=1 Tax=Nocardioides donggukensis TaxID=2774019 RepID=A0A927Q3F4_9ACTN|nr:glycosyltransferase family 39 protein [Nocardioides donggukensis]MBD8870541.1 glycosyltransferase family 39 protein [Nocardioides donggukensis]
MSLTTTARTAASSPDSPAQAQAQAPSGVDPTRTRSSPRGGPRARWGRPDAAALRRHLPLAGLLLGTALLYLWGLGASGWANSYYSAAAQAGSESWKAFFFGSFDAANAITVDKTPLSLWPMALSVRLFGLSSWAILVPQALMGVAAVALLHGGVRRATGSPAAGLLAGSVLALTPVATLMFRFNNPDALLVLLLVGAASATLRAVEATQDGTSSGTRWLVLGGALVGLGFLTKMLQAFLVLPALALTFAIFAGIPLAKRVLPLLAAFGAMVAASGWWIAIVELWPASSRPYIGGSQGDSILELTLGYNGLGRLTGEQTGSVGGGGGWGATGPWRMFDSEIGSQIAWLLPAAVVLGIAGLWFARGLAHRRLVQAALTLWLGWLAVTVVTFSFMAGIFHAYYTVALAPAIAALVALGGWVLWRQRAAYAAAATLAFTTAFTSAWAFMLLDRSDWQPWLKYAVVTVGLAAALMLAGIRHLPRPVGTVVATAALLAALAGPAAYSLATAATPHTGSIPTAGPSSGAAAGADPRGAAGGAGDGAGDGAGGGTGAGTDGGVGGLLTGSTSTAELTALLQQDADAWTWSAAVVGANSAAGYQLASGEPVLALGGFNGSDPSPTLAEFQEYVADGEIHYFISGGGGFGGRGGAGGPGGGGDSEIATWVSETFTARTVDGVTVYDLSDGVR